jgi:hypothetical protein
MKKLSTLQTVILTSFILIAIPVFVQAAGTQPTAASAGNGILSLATLVRSITDNLIAALSTLFMSLALLAFFYGIVEYIWGKRQGDVNKTKVGNDFIKWALVALFCMFSVYGIIKFVQNTLSPGADWSTITIPNIIFNSGGGIPSGAQGYTSPGAGAGIPAGATGNSAGVPAGSAGSTKKPNAYSCTYDSECQSGFCDPVDDTCTNPSQASLRANGFSCTSSAQCTSGFCDPVDDTCTNPSQASLRPNGFSCTSSAQCTSGFCDSADDTCTARAGLPAKSPCSGSGQGPCANGLECIESTCQ